MHLRPLPRLIILDLSGNPLCRETDYRSYVVYHLRKLNVLGTLRMGTHESNTLAHRIAR
jgi:hypothetical protein